ncbi:site-specific integrase [Geobacter luticola]|uniref:Site-specific integrase n=2 Tax=Geomobilimonas luticola TaxID=1114878 RepID=A0ABS5SEF4_9BACT|nr:site-specific integrase [Geomobilimonas luticola]
MVRESTHSTRLKDAEALLTTRRNEVLEGRTPMIRKIQNPTFAEMVEKYKEFVSGQKSYTWKKYMLRQLVKEFGNVKLNNFSVELLERFRSKLLREGLDSLSSRVVYGKKKPVRPATANRFFALISHVFTKAYEWELCTEEVLKRIRKVKLLRENNQRTEFLSLEESKELTEACDLTTDTKYLKPIITFALNSGCRKEEVLGLKWEHVDLRHGRITLTETKNGEKRMIPINSTLRETLQGIVRHISSPYVFCDAKGNRYNDIRKTFEKACKRIGRSGLHFHDLRHTYASQLVMLGVDLTTVSRLLGHKSLTMTLRYSHLAPNHLDDAVERLAVSMNGVTSQLVHNGQEKRVSLVS